MSDIHRLANKICGYLSLAKGNDGVATFLRYLPGAIGYVVWDFTKQNHMAHTAMKNASGAVVQPEVETFKAAARGAGWQRRSIKS
jgi:phosphate transport system substrate-binding protein